MNTEIVTEKVIDPAKGIPVLIMDLVMLVASVVLMCVSVALFGAGKALFGALLLIAGIVMFIAFFILLAGLKTVRPNEALPSYLAHFDACLNLFDASPLSRDVSPLKFYEYLATGKPVVSTREPLQVEDFADVVYIAHDADEFLALCDKAAAEHDPDKVVRRLAYGAQCSWAERVHQIEQVLYAGGVLHES